MKIAGVAGGKHPTLKKGDVIELEPDKKICFQARQELSARAEEGFAFLTTKAEVIGTVQVVKGRPLKIPEPDQFIGTVLLSYRPLRLKDDRLFPEKKIKVKIHCKDSKDSLGIPDVETVKYSVVG